MKVAVASDDGTTVAVDFGFARQFVVITVADSKVVEREVRSKAVDARPSTEKVERDPNDHFAGHRVGKGPRSRYDEMAAEIGDCEAVLAGSFGTGARSALKGYGIEPLETPEGVEVERAARDYAERLAGRAEDPRS